MSGQPRPDDPAALDEALELTLGRRAPYSQVGDWVLLTGAACEARTLYWALSAHINVTRDDTEVWPGLLTLARILGLRKAEAVTRYMLQLEVIGAVDVVRTGAGLKRRNRYVVHQTPPAEHQGPHSMSQWYALNRPANGEPAERRKRREAQFDAWLAAVREGLKEHCDRVAMARAAASKAKQPLPPLELFRPPALELSRTPAEGGTGSPAPTQKRAGRVVPPPAGVRTPAGGGLVPPQEGVEQDQQQQDQQASPCPPDDQESRTSDHLACGSAEGVTSATRAREVRPRRTQQPAAAGEGDALHAEQQQPTPPLSRELASRVPRTTQQIGRVVGKVNAYQRDRLNRLVSGLLIDGEDDAMIAARLDERLKPLATGDPEQPYRFRRDGLSWALTIGLPYTPGGMTHVPCRNPRCGNRTLGRATTNVRCDSCESAAREAAEAPVDSGAVPPPLDELLRQIDRSHPGEDHVPPPRSDGDVTAQPHSAPADMLPRVVREQIDVITAANPTYGAAAEKAATEMYTVDAGETHEQQRNRIDRATAAFHTATGPYAELLRAHYTANPA